MPNYYDENARRTTLPVYAGRFSPGKPAHFEKIEDRTPTTKYPKAGESVQPHVLFLRGPAYQIINDAFAAGFEYVLKAGLMKVRLARPITADDYVDALRDAYRLAGMSEADARERISTKPGDHPKIGMFSVLTETGKMGCYSFNLPAGPMFQGGACPSSEIGFMMQTQAELEQQMSRTAFDRDIHVADFICNGCYALKGSYGNPSMVFMMGMRKRLIDGWLSEGTFVTNMVAAIQSARDKSIKRRKKSPRASWWKIPHPDFFRIHDAGDMFSPKYTEAWFGVCRSLPEINFWAPTRMWILKGSANKVYAQGVPENLALRPSALHFGESAPQVTRAASKGAELIGAAGERVSMPGMSAGSGSGSKVPSGAWQCPAYDHKTKGGGAEFAFSKEGKKLLSKEGDPKLKAGTCSRAQGPDSPFHGGDDASQSAEPKGHGCRACWLHRDTQIFYHEH